MSAAQTPAGDETSTRAGAKPVERPLPGDGPEPPHRTLVTPPAASRTVRRRWVLGGGVLALLLILFEGVPWLLNALTTVSTDDAYVNGHVTFVAPRVPGQVTRVLVDDNNRVKAGDLLVQLDREPYRVRVSIARAKVDAARADLVAAEAQARSTEGEARSLRFDLDHAIEDVDNQVSLMRARVAALDSDKAAVTRAQSDYDRAQRLHPSGAASTEEVEHRRQALRTAQADLKAALEGVYEIRESLGLPARPPSGDDLAQVPPDLDQTYSKVREAQAKLIQVMAKLGYAISFERTPAQMIADFYKRDAQGDIDRILAQIRQGAPAVAQAKSKVSEARRALDQARLDLRYTDVVAEIDGVITRREVNPGDDVVVGQGLMAIRSLTDIWVDANFKETQLVDLRIGQPADLYVDMYGKRHVFEGRVSGFTMGTGSTLALLPPENATGNFVKVVQRLPVRIDLTDYDPDKAPLFIGLSVTPYVHVRATPTGPDAGRMLQLRPAQPGPAPSAPPTGR
jgi:membrane fusion protein (multidrug efflux system)